MNTPSTHTAREATPLRGRTVLVTGGAHRVGGAVSRHLGALGARVLVAYNSSAGAAEELVATLPAGGRALHADLAAADGAERLLADCAEGGDLPDGLVHAAASFLRKPAVDTTAADWDRVFALNTRAFFLLAREFARRHGVGADGRLAGGGEGGGGEGGGGEGTAPPDLCLVTVIDSGALELWTNYAVHCVSKAALVPLVQVLAKALGPAVRVNGIFPGPVLPEEDSTDEERAAMEERTLLKRLGAPMDVARAAAYLLTNTFTTATLLEVTGGAHLWRGKLER